MPTVQKEGLVDEIKERLAASGGIILADYRGLSVKEMQELRVKVRAAGADLKIYKNRLTQIALRELAMPVLDEYLAGPTALVFMTDDPVAPAKVLQEFAKGHPALEVKGGLVESQVVDAASVIAIALLPSREELIAKVMSLMISPIRGFMGMANAPASAFARVIQAVADQKAAA
jgi:large subunit ribosomal protein L10